jgi:hypothetical protein
MTEDVELETEPRNLCHQWTGFRQIVASRWVRVNIYLGLAADTSDMLEKSPHTDSKIHFSQQDGIDNNCKR